jgi:hypothetical protein
VPCCLYSLPVRDFPIILVLLKFILLLLLLLLLLLNYYIIIIHVYGNSIMGNIYINTMVNKTGKYD